MTVAEFCFFARMRSYIELNIRTRPCRKGVFYECVKCGGIIPSDTMDNVRCSCRNVFIDADAGRISFLDSSKVRCFEES